MKRIQSIAWHDVICHAPGRLMNRIARPFLRLAMRVEPHTPLSSAAWLLLVPPHGPTFLANNHTIYKSGRDVKEGWSTDPSLLQNWPGTFCQTLLEINCATSSRTPLQLPPWKRFRFRLELYPPKIVGWVQVICRWSSLSPVSHTDYDYNYDHSWSLKISIISWISSRFPRISP